MSAAHTPGPWVVVPHPTCTALYVRPAARADEQSEVAVVYGGLQPDAALIAAAPELLEALRALHRAADDVASLIPVIEVMEAQFPKQWRRFATALDAARDAIAKAVQP